jgi:hypothetical protein
MLFSFVVSALADHSGVVPAKPGEATYNLSDFQVVNAGHSETDGAFVVVSFSAAWSQASFPGYAECEVRLLDKGGGILGSQYFKYASYRADPDHISTSIGVGSDQAASTASSVEGDCSAATKPPSSAGYELSNLEVSSTGGSASERDQVGAAGPRLTFVAHWSTAEPPMLQSCEAKFLLPDGTSSAFSFEISLGNGDEGTILLPPGLDGSTPTSISCGVFDGGGHA